MNLEQGAVCGDCMCTRLVRLVEEGSVHPCPSAYLLASLRYPCAPGNVVPGSRVLKLGKRRQ